MSQGKEKIADQRRKILSKNTKSDHLTVVNAFQVKLTFSAACVGFPLVCDAYRFLCIARGQSMTIVFSLCQGWEEAKRRGYRYEREYCWDNFLSANTLQVSLQSLSAIYIFTKPSASQALCTGFSL